MQQIRNYGERPEQKRKVRDIDDYIFGDSDENLDE